MFETLTLSELICLFRKIHRAFRVNNAVSSNLLVFAGKNDMSDAYGHLVIDLWSIHTDLYQQIESLYDGLSSRK